MPTQTYAEPTALELPALSLVLRRALSLLEEGEALEGDLAQLVEVDAVLTGSVMRVVRCPVYGAAKRHWTLTDSLERIGRSVLQRMFSALPCLHDARSREAVERACRHWVHGIAVAAAARWLSNQGEFDDPAEAYLTGLMLDVGRLVAEPDAPPKRLSRLTDRLLSDWRVSWRIVAVSRHLLEPDGEPGEAGETVAPEDTTARKLLDVITRSRRMATALGFGLEEGVAPPCDDAALSSVEDAINLELAHASALLALPDGAPEDFLRVLTNEELRTSDTATGGTTAEQAVVFTAGNVAAVHQAIVAMRGMNRVSDILQAGLRSLHKGLDFGRVILFEPETEHPDRVRGRLVQDPTRIGVLRGARGVVLPTDPQGAIRRALDTGMPARGEDPLHDQWALERLGVHQFAVAPVRAGTVNLGVVVADRFFTNRPIADEDVGMLGLLCASLGLVIENMALDAQAGKLRSLAVKDELTGIDNRRNLLLSLQREIERARRYGKPLSVVMIDVDLFKRWNDIHGHQVGDMVLQRVAQLVSSSSREIDSYGRYGGEEFVVVLPETPVDHAVLYAERLRVAVEQQGEQLITQFPGTKLSISIGVTHLAASGDDLEQVIHRADSALYAAKKFGRNRVCVRGPAESMAGPISDEISGDVET